MKKVFWGKGGGFWGVLALAALVSLLAAFCLAACSNASDTYIISNVTEDSSKTEKTYPIEVATLVEKIVDWRGYDAETKGVKSLGRLLLGFKSGNDDIPYFPVEQNMMNAWFGKDFYKISQITADTTQVTITNAYTNAKAVIDLLHRKIAFDNYDAFFQKGLVYKDIAGLGAKIDWLKMAYSANIAGKPLTVYWGGAPNIDIFIWRDQNGDCAVAFPFQTFCDLFNSQNCFALFYNGTYLYHSIEDEPVANEYYSAAPTGKRSKLLADYCYDELCFNLDLNYGLKAIHGIDNFKNFDEFFALAGVRDALKSEDSLTFSNALKDVCEFFFADGHSLYDNNSWRLGRAVKVPGTKRSTFREMYDQNLKKYAYDARNPAYHGTSTDKKDPVPCYEVSGKTAIVRFDNFTDNDSNIASLNAQLVGFDDAKMNVYAGDKDAEKAVVTAAMIHAVNEKIKAAGSSIENVVLDLSCNGGGSCRTAAFVLAWMLGECYFELSNHVTGAKCTAVYQADVNFDGNYDDGDTIKDKKLFCLVSPLSFSCGNMVPAMLKASGNATILGVTSGGGTSVVHSSCAADGTVFHYSSKIVMSVSKNGSTYNIDQGIEPHYYINKPENFYNKATIAALVDSINEGKL